jgi:uncharacterized protein (DUF433 family)
VIDEYVEQREATYFVRGSRVSLDSIVHSFLSGDSAESIRDNFPTLTLQQVYGAIAYYLGHQAEIDAYLRAGQEDFEQGRCSQSHIADELRTRLDRARGRTAKRQ